MPATRATEHEWSLLIAACSLNPKESVAQTLQGQKNAPRWEVVLDLAEKHGVQPLLYQSLVDAKEAVPAESFRVLAQSYQTNVHKSIVLSRELIRIVDCLAEDRIEVMPYKGVALAEAVYGDIALRQSGDIDLLIHASDFGRIREDVRELGYTPHSPLSEAEERASLESGYECVFDGSFGRNLLEVQWAIQPRFYAVNIEVREIFERCITISVAGRAMKTPSFEDLFIVLALHAAKHVWGRLIWLCDLARVMARKDLDWVQIASHARRLGIVRILRITLLLASRVLGSQIPENAERQLPQDRAAAALAREIEPHILNEEAYDVESTGYFRLMLRLRERRRDQARFVSRLALTPGPGEWATIRLPSPLFPLYRLVRISRLAARLVRT